MRPHEPARVLGHRLLDADDIARMQERIDAAGLRRSLRAAGIPAVVSYLPAGQKSCIAPPPLPQQGAGEPPGEPGKMPGPKIGSKVTVSPDGATFTVSPQTQRRTAPSPTPNRSKDANRPGPLLRGGSRVYEAFS